MTEQNVELNENLVIEFGKKYINSKKDTLKYRMKYFDEFKDGELDFIVSSIFYASHIFNQIGRSLVNYQVRTTFGKFNAMVDDIIETLITETTEIILGSTLETIVENKLKEITTLKEKSLYFVLSEALEEGYTTVSFLRDDKYRDIKTIELNEKQQNQMGKFEIDLISNQIVERKDKFKSHWIADLKK